MKHNNRLFALLLVTLACISCQSTENVQSETVSAVPVSETEATTAADPVDALFTQEKQDNQNKPYTILSCEYQSYEFNAETEIGEPVNDAVFQRNRAVEELLGIDLQFVYKPGSYEQRSSYFGLVKASVMAEDHAYDLVTGMISCMVPYAASGVYVSFYDIPNLDLNAPWFVTEMKDMMTFDGKLYFYAGDTSLSMYHDLSVIFANLNLLRANDSEDPYTLVKNGKWTLDALSSLCKEAGQDLNGDSKMTPDYDSFGLTYVNIRAISLQCAFNINIVGHEGDSLVINPLSERVTTATEQLDNFLALDCVCGEAIDDYSMYLNAFTGDRSLFFLSRMIDTEQFRNMKSDYAILPLPKFEEEQTSYYTLLPTSSQIMFVPTTSDLALTGYVIDAMNYYSYKMTVPAYYDTTLTEKYSRDKQTQEMLSIIRTGITLPLDYAHGGRLGGALSVHRLVFDLAEMHQSNTITSKYEKYTKSWEKGLAKLTEEYSKEDT